MEILNKHISEPWFTLIKLGIKKVEARLAKSDWLTILEGDYITFTNQDIIFRSFTVKITKIDIYQDFSDYLKNQKLSECLPSIENIEDALLIYNKYYSQEDQDNYNVIAMRFEVI